MVKIGRNSSCPCGSGKKYKKCCINKYKFNNEERKRPWIKEEVEEFSTEKIIFKLIDLGIPFDKDEFLEKINEYYSAEEISENWYEKYHIKAKGFDQDFPWLAAWVLWERLAPEEMKCNEQIDDMMQYGYDLLRDNQILKACDIWLEVWDILKERIAFEINSLAEEEKVFKGTQVLFNWCQHLEEELGRAGRIDKSYYGKRIRYCQEFCELMPETEERMIKTMKRFEAASYFGLGQQEKGAKKFKELINKYPNWVWGYVGWGDMYTQFRLNENIPKNLDKAKEIYKMGLKVDLDDSEGEEIIRERLNTLY